MVIKGEKQESHAVKYLEGKKELQNQKNSTKSDQRNAETPSTNFNMMFFSIILIYIVAYIPTMVAIFIFLSHVQIVYFRLFRFIAGFYVLNNAANPFAYAYFDMQIRQKVVSLCCRKVLYMFVKLNCLLIFNLVLNRFEKGNIPKILHCLLK